MENPWLVLNTALAAFVVAAIGLLAWQVRQWLKQKATGEQLAVIQWVAAMAVQAAEQYGGEAAEKKRIAIGQAETWLKENGIFLDLHTLDAAIEAALYKEINKFKRLNQVEGNEYDYLIPGAAITRDEAAQ